MFKVRPIRTCAKFEPVKEPEAQIPSVELITELVEVELQELGFYVMVSVQYASLGIADGNVYPRQNFPDTLFVICNNGMVGGYHTVFFKSGITAEPVRGHIGIPIRPRLYLARNGGSLEIANDLHLYMPDSPGRAVVLDRRRSGLAAFRQQEHGRKLATHRQMTALHDRARAELHLMPAIHARPGLVARIPAQAQTAALATEQTVVLTETTQRSLARGLVRVLTVKIKQVHNIYSFILHTYYIKHKVFQNMPFGHLGGLNFANLGTCGHS